MAIYNCIAALIHGPLMIYTFNLSPMQSTIMNHFSMITCLKVVSYSHTMSNTRAVIQNLRKSKMDINDRVGVGII